MIRNINSPTAPAPNGPYSHGVRYDNLVFTSGQLPIRPDTGKITDENIKSQTRQVFQNIQTVLEAAGTNLDHLIKVTVYLLDKKRYFEDMNEVYGEYVRHNPARTTIETSFIKEMPKKALIEIDVVAHIE